MRNSAEDTFRRLYMANFTAILDYALRRVNGPDDAKDLVAETFLVAWRRRDEMPQGEQARLWLYGVARRVLANHHRGEQRRLNLGERLRLELRESTCDPAADLVDVLAVDAALASLDDTDREVLELTVWDQLTPREIGVLLDLPARVVRSRLHRARAHMRARQCPPASRTAARTNEDPRRDVRARPGHVPNVRTTPAPEKGRKA